MRRATFEANVSISGKTVTNSNTIVASAVNNFSLANVSISGGTITNSKTIEALANHAADFTQIFQNGTLVTITGGRGRRHDQRQRHRYQFRHHLGVGNRPEQRCQRVRCWRRYGHQCRFRHDGGVGHRGKRRDVAR